MHNPQRQQVFPNLNQKNQASGANADGASGAHQDVPVRNRCHICDGDDDEESMLRCGGCTARAHVLCLGMGEEHPGGTWWCGDRRRIVSLGSGKGFPRRSRGR